MTPYRQVPAPTVSERDEVSHSRHKSLLIAKKDNVIAVFNELPRCNVQQNGVTAPYIPNLGTRWRGVASSTMRPISCRQKTLAAIGQ